MLTGILTSGRAYWIYSKGNVRICGISKVHYIEYCFLLFTDVVWVT